MADKEQTVISYFPSSTKAQDAADALASAGFEDSHVKRVSRFGAVNDTQRGAGNTAGELSGLTLYSTTDISETRSEKVLLDADPSVSGMSAKGYGMAGGHAWTLVTFVPSDRIEEAVQIIKENGGET